MDTLIKKISSFKTASKLLEFLEKTDNDTLMSIKKTLDDKYYNEGLQLVTDEYYDLIKEALGDLDTVGAKLREGDNKTKLPFWLGSMDKIKQDEDTKIDSWKSKNVVSLANHHNYIVSSKLDGVSCLAIFSPTEIKLYTRGDGITGSDISHLSKFIKSIPKKLKIPEEGLAVRGELIIPEKIFKKKYADKYENPRNMIAGLIGSKTSREGLTDIHFVVYEIVAKDVEMPSPEKQLKTLDMIGFEVVKYQIQNDISSEILTEILARLKQESDYELDGIIVQSNIKYTRNTSKNPKYAFAFKIQGETADTTVISVEWKVSQWGALKPVVIINPVKLSGVTISKATGYNGKFIIDNVIGPGAVVTIIRSGDVIPKIINIVKPAKSGKPQLPEIPYKWTETKVDLLVDSSKQDSEALQDINNEMCVKRINRFFEKLDIKELGQARIQKLYENGIDTIIKIISSTKEELIDALDSEKLGEKIYTNIKEGLRGIKTSNLLGSTGVFGEGIGQRKLEVLFENIPNILEIADSEDLKEQILKTPGYSDISANLIVDNIQYAIIFMNSVKPFILKSEKVSSPKIKQTLTGKKFIVSGFRDKDLKTDVENLGGEIIDTWKVSADGLIVDKKAKEMETGKVKKANEKGMPVYTVEEFRKLFIS